MCVDAWRYVVGVKWCSNSLGFCIYHKADIVLLGVDLLAMDIKTSGTRQSGYKREKLSFNKPLEVSSRWGNMSTITGLQKFIKPRESLLPTGNLGNFIRELRWFF